MGQLRKKCDSPENSKSLEEKTRGKEKCPRETQVSEEQLSNRKQLLHMYAYNTFSQIVKNLILYFVSKTRLYTF